MAAYREVFQALEALVAASAVNEEVLQILLPKGVPLGMEAQLWDFKRELPARPDTNDSDATASYKAKIADLMKDAVALHNSFGGYIVFGVADKGAHRVVGSQEVLDAGDFNKRLEGATGRSIECLFGSVVLAHEGQEIPLGLLFVPRRSDGQTPVAFRKAAPAHPGASAKRAYGANECFVRIRDESRPAAATSSDWEFLHGPRRITPSAVAKPKAPIQVSLPPRDPDLVEFIGRDVYLDKLRSWLGDPRSAVRLLTGIGGLGKTSIAYKFAEEVADLRAGNVEKLVWLTAKQRTFSALRGTMVEASRTDFNDAHSLYEVLLQSLGYEPLFDDEEPTDTDLLEAVHEALSYYNCLIVIDDVDSLSPDDQKEVVFSLSNIASRTINGDNTPSRILFTSRVDLGVSPATVIKVDGFNKNEFSSYVESVALVLGVSIPKDVNHNDFYAATSGSPLFAASVLRLVKLGTGLEESLDRWRGEDGEEVRRFAFERELQRLPASAARLLYAICLLGRTTSVELSSVLELSSTAVSSGISSLQSFHLVTTSLASKSGVAIGAPDDVTLTMDVLRKHLGGAAELVEAACTNARKAVASRRDQISSAIGQIISLWKVDEHKAALIEAEKLSAQNPTNGDVTCLLATALLKPKVQNWARADEKFALASKQKCARPELIEGWITAKEKLEDWTGLLNLTATTVSTRSGGDKVLRANIQATEELIKLARLRGDRSRRIELARLAISTISSRMASERLPRFEREEVFRKKFNFARLLLDDIASAAVRQGDQIAVFEAMTWLVEHDVFVSEFVIRGAHALTEWWSDVERRPYIDEGARNLVKRSLSRLEHVERILDRNGKEDVAEQVRQIAKDLAYRAAKLLVP